MSKMKQCYYVMNMVSHEVVTNINLVTIGTENIITFGSFAQFDKQREAKKHRRKYGGIIIKGLREVQKDE